MLLPSIHVLQEDVGGLPSSFGSMHQQERHLVMAAPEELSFLTRCPKCKRQTVQVRFRSELEKELAEDHLTLYCGHCDLTWQGSYLDKDQARYVLSAKSPELS